MTEFLRPEDGVWDVNNKNLFYFVTTNNVTSPSRLYRLRFKDSSQPWLGGVIDTLLNGTEGQRMMDNIGINRHGKLIIQEDIGNNADLGKLWRFDLFTNSLTQIAEHNAALFTPPAPPAITLDEESSGVLDLDAIVGGRGKWMVNVQTHVARPAPFVEDGQILFMIDEKSGFGPATPGAN